MSLNDKNNNSQVFVMLPESVVNELLDNQREMKEILSKTNNTKDNAVNLDDWLDEKATQKLLGKKATTLYYLRKKGSIEYTKVGNKTFYSRVSILEFMEKNKK